MSKIAKQVAAGVFLTILKATGYSVKNCPFFSAGTTEYHCGIFDNGVRGFPVKYARHRGQSPLAGCKAAVGYQSA
jgi:hypothetical protein